MENAGIVYILTNPSFKDDIVKIGITSGTVEKRMKELHTTGVPTPFEWYAIYQTPEYKKVERFLHTSLSLLVDNRINPKREFFKIRPEVALDYLMQVAELIGGDVIPQNREALLAKGEIVKRRAYNDIEEWISDNDKESLRNVIDKLIEIGFGFHLGTSDLRIDFTPDGSKKSYNCLMLLGNKDYASFQPSELYKLAEACGKESSIIDSFLSDIQPYLSQENKHKPYELITGYYNISHNTLDEVTRIYSQLMNALQL
jgi:hypothetical protein